MNFQVEKGRGCGQVRYGFRTYADGTNELDVERPYSYKAGEANLGRV